MQKPMSSGGAQPLDPAAAKALVRFIIFGSISTSLLVIAPLLWTVLSHPHARLPLPLLAWCMGVSVLWSAALFIRARQLRKR
jgi:hypothetical protein